MQQGDTSYLTGNISLYHLCSQSPDAQKQDAKALSENTDAVKAAQAKIKALTSRRRRSASAWRIATCTELTTEVKTLTVYISENPKSTKIKVRNVFYTSVGL